ncbi:MAG TPA: polysaccharide deacetylase family protein [Candidatus Sulfotelmatobacter sp.]|nr:polysaccharide deacetylase family protein [Candidatus Sulfotelmatobacter sp.]
MRVVSSILKRVVYPGLARVGYFRAVTRPGLAVITYHGVLPAGYKLIDPGFDGSLITAETLRQQLRLLKTKYTVIAPEEMRSWCRNEGALPPRAAVLTCDDGFLSNLTEMLPILQDEGLQCLFFVTGASINDQPTMLWYEELLLLFLRAPAGEFHITGAGIEADGVLGEREQRRALWWSLVRRLSQIDAERRKCFLDAAHAHFGMENSLDYFLASYREARRHFGLMTRTELQQLAAAGMTIGAHTLTHPILAEQPSELAWTEITESRARLEQVIGKPIWAFAYPFGYEGSVSARVIAMAKQAGFDAAFVNTGGGLGAELPLYAIPRVHINAGISLAEFEAQVSGLHELLRRRRRKPPPTDVSVLDTLHT